MPDDNAHGAPNPDGTQPDNKSKAGGKTYTQAELDKLVGDRVARAQRQAEKTAKNAVEDALQSFRDEYGLDDEVLAKVGQQDQTAMEMRTLKSQTTKAQKALDALQQRHDLATGRLTDALTRDAVMRAAATKSNDPELVWLALQNQIKVDMDNDFGVYTVEDGNPSERTIDELVDNLLTQKKHLAAPSGVHGGAGSRVSQPGGDKPPDPNTVEGRQAILAKGFSAG